MASTFALRLPNAIPPTKQIVMIEKNSPSVIEVCCDSSLDFIFNFSIGDIS